MTTIKQFETDTIESYDDKNPDWVQSTLNSVMYFHEKRNRRSDDPSTAQAKSFSAIRKGIYEKLPKVKTGDDYIDKQDSRWDQTRVLTMNHPQYEKLVSKVDPIHLLKYNKASKAHNEQLRTRVQAKQTEAVKKFSITKCMQTAFKVLNEKDPDPFELFVVLLYVTGRRQHELWDKMLFQQADWNGGLSSAYTLKASYFAKSMSKESVTIPCLFRDTIVLKRIAEFREIPKKKSGVNSYNRDISKACQSLFPDASNPHQLRALYAETCNRIFNNSEYNEKQLKTAVYKKNSLHHGSIKTSNQHYEIIASDLQSDEEVTAFHKKFEAMNEDLTGKTSQTK